MNGPPETKTLSAPAKTPETSVVRIALTGAIDFYRKRISPIGASRCGFHPSCSAFGLQAVREKGVLLGVIMTADRLTRCNIFKGPGPDYLLLPDGRLFDPVSGNLLSEP
jgi:putative membrane protein insertion efficiency factor